MEDTLIGSLLPSYTKTITRKPVMTPKFYFFDVGVANHLSHRFQISPKSEIFGKCFEHFIYTEIRAFLSDTNDLRKLSYWRSQSKHEVDFIIGDSVAIDIKGTEMVQPKHLKGMLVLAEEIDFKHKIIVSLDPKPRLLDQGILVLPYKEFLKRLWNGEL